MNSTTKKEVETMKRITKIEANDKLQKIQQIAVNSLSAWKLKKITMKPISKVTLTGIMLVFIMMKGSPVPIWQSEMVL
jgi:hypothetical protein